MNDNWLCYDEYMITEGKRFFIFTHFKESLNLTAKSESVLFYVSARRIFTLFDTCIYCNMAICCCVYWILKGNCCTYICIFEERWIQWSYFLCLFLLDGTNTHAMLTFMMYNLWCVLQLNSPLLDCMFAMFCENASGACFVIDCRRNQWMGVCCEIKMRAVKSSQWQ